MIPIQDYYSVLDLDRYITICAMLQLPMVCYAYQLYSV